MLEQLPGTAGTRQVGALGENAVIGLDRRRAAHRAAFRRPGQGRAPLVLDDVRRRRDDLRDDVTGAYHDHVLAGADVLAHDVLLVVERRHLDRHPRHGHGREHGVRVQVAELPRVPHHFLQPRHRRGRWELPGDRPARVAPDRAEPALKLEIVDLDHGAVDLEVELAPARLPGPALRDHLVGAVEQADLAIDAEAVLAQPRERLEMRPERQAVRDPDLIAPDRQRPLGRVGRIQLADRPGGRVAWVHERRLAGFGTALVQRREVFQ